MTTESVRARLYLLRQTSEDESLAIEREYFDSDRAQEAIAAAEEDLIEDYLDDALTADERASFEREYLPGHRGRVETIRRLREAAASPASNVTTGTFGAVGRSPALRLTMGVLAAAAAVILAVGIVVWNRARPLTPATTRTAAGQVAQRPGGATPSRQRVFAFTVPADTLRGASDTAALLVPTGTEIVALELPAGSGAAVRATVTTVGGDEIWAGPVERTNAGVTRIAVPASRLAPNDYIITVWGGDPESSDRYVLHVRAH